MINNEYKKSIFALMKASNMQEINKLDDALLKQASDNDDDDDLTEDGNVKLDINNPDLYEEGKPVGDISIQPTKNPRQQKNLVVETPRIDNTFKRQQNIQNKFHQLSNSPSDELFDLDNILSPHMSKPITYDANTEKENAVIDLDSKESNKYLDVIDNVFLKTTEEWNKSQLKVYDIEAILKELLTEYYIRNNFGLDKEALLKSYVLWLNTKYLSLSKNKNAPDIKQKFLALIELYKCQIIDPGYGYDNGINHQATYAMMENLYFVYTTLCFICQTTPQKPKQFFEMYGAKEAVAARFSKEDIELFINHFYIKSPNQEKELINKKAQKISNMRKWFDTFLINKPDEEQATEILKYYHNYQDIYNMVQNQKKNTSDKPVTENKKYTGLNNHQIASLLSMYGLIQTLDNTNKNKEVIIPARVVKPPTKPTKMVNNNRTDEEYDILKERKIETNELDEMIKSLLNEKANKNSEPSKEVMDIGTVELDVVDTKNNVSTSNEIEIKEEQAKPIIKREKAMEIVKALMDLYNIPEFSPHTRRGENTIRNVLKLQTASWLSTEARRKKELPATVGMDLLQEICKCLPKQNYRKIDDRDLISFINNIKAEIANYRASFNYHTNS